jgi:hypothetical protein
MKRHSIKNRDDNSKLIDVRSLDKRERPLNIRKGMPKKRQTGFFDSTPEHEQLLFDEPLL